MFSTDILTPANIVAVLLHFLNQKRAALIHLIVLLRLIRVIIISLISQSDLVQRM